MVEDYGGVEENHNLVSVSSSTDRLRKILVGEDSSKAGRVGLTPLGSNNNFADENDAEHCQKYIRDRATLDRMRGTSWRNFEFNKIPNKVVEKISSSVSSSSSAGTTVAVPFPSSTSHSNSNSAHFVVNSGKNKSGKSKRRKKKSSLMPKLDSQLEHIIPNHPETDALFIVRCNACDRLIQSAYFYSVHVRENSKGLPVCTATNKSIFHKQSSNCNSTTKGHSESQSTLVPQISSKSNIQPLRIKFQKPKPKLIPTFVSTTVGGPERQSLVIPVQALQPWKEEEDGLGGESESNSIQNLIQNMNKPQTIQLLKNFIQHYEQNEESPDQKEIKFKLEDRTPAPANSYFEERIKNNDALSLSVNPPAKILNVIESLDLQVTERLMSNILENVRWNFGAVLGEEMSGKQKEAKNQKKQKSITSASSNTTMQPPIKLKIQLLKKRPEGHGTKTKTKIKSFNNNSNTTHFKTVPELMLPKLELQAKQDSRNSTNSNTNSTSTSSAFKPIPDLNRVQVKGHRPVKGASFTPINLSSNKPQSKVCANSKMDNSESATITFYGSSEPSSSCPLSPTIGHETESQISIFQSEPQSALPPVPVPAPPSDFLNKQEPKLKLMPVPKPNKAKVPLNHKEKDVLSQGPPSSKTEVIMATPLLTLASGSSSDPAEVVDPQKYLPLKDRVFDSNKHCGVVSADKNTGLLGSPCKRSLTCKSHSVILKREVKGRRKDFDELLLQLRQANFSSGNNSSGGNGNGSKRKSTSPHGVKGKSKGQGQQLTLGGPSPGQIQKDSPSSLRPTSGPGRKDMDVTPERTGIYGSPKLTANPFSPDVCNSWSSPLKFNSKGKLIHYAKAASVGGGSNSTKISSSNTSGDLSSLSTFSLTSPSSQVQKFSISPHGDGSWSKRLKTDSNYIKNAPVVTRLFSGSGSGSGSGSRYGGGTTDAAAAKRGGQTVPTASSTLKPLSGPISILPVTETVTKPAPSGILLPVSLHLVSNPPAVVFGLGAAGGRNLNNNNKNSNNSDGPYVLLSSSMLPQNHNRNQ